MSPLRNTMFGCCSNPDIKKEDNTHKSIRSWERDFYSVSRKRGESAREKCSNQEKRENEGTKTWRENSSIKLILKKTHIWHSIKPYQLWIMVIKKLKMSWYQEGTKLIKTNSMFQAARWAVRIYSADHKISYVMEPELNMAFITKAHRHWTLNWGRENLTHIEVEFWGIKSRPAMGNL
jgi:hypothetical protein